MAELPPLGDHAYVYPGVPPPAVVVAVPLLLLQTAGVDAMMLTVKAEGAVMVTCAESILPIESVTITV